MKECPIIFSTDMVRAILEGRKTQTRRVITPQPRDKSEKALTFVNNTLKRGLDVGCPYGQVGDRLWVRETWAVDYTFDNTPICDLNNNDFVFYKSMPDPYTKSIRGKWRPSIFMPRWASRLTLEIAVVRAERLQDISVDDTKAEGCAGRPLPGQLSCRNDGYQYIKEFISVWDSLNAKRGHPWESNPWVWVLEFNAVGIRQK